MSDLHFFVSNLMFGVDLHFSFAFFALDLQHVLLNRGIAFFLHFYIKHFFRFLQICHFLAEPLAKLEKYKKH